MDFTGVRVVAFDLDQTLVDFWGAKRAAAAAAARAARAPDPRARAGALVGALREGDADRDAVEEVLGGAVAPRARRAFDRAERRGTRAYPGAARTLRALRARGYALALVTDAPRPRAVARLRGAGLARAFDVALTREDSPRGKEDDAPYRLLATRLGVRPEEILMVGDHPRRDVGVPRELGCRTVHALHGYDPRLASDRAGDVPHATLHALPDLLQWLPKPLVAAPSLGPLAGRPPLARAPAGA